MASFRMAARALADSIRGRVPGNLDLRPHRVTVRVRTWSGGRPGVGTKADVDTVVTNAGFNPRVQQVTSKDVIASGGLYASGDYKVGPITPAFPGGGVQEATIDPPSTATAREVFYRIVGPGFPASGQWCKRVDDNGLQSFRNVVVVRVTAVTP